MTGRDILLATLRGQSAPRVPWVPFVGCHGGALIGVDASAYISNANYLVAGACEARRRYRPDGLPVIFDLQLEAEVLGCRPHWSQVGPPSVQSHPLGEGRDVASLPSFGLNRGRIPQVMEATRRLRDVFADEVALYGLLCGPFTLAMHLWGNELFLVMFDDPERVQAVLGYCAEVGLRMADAYLDAGCDVIAVVDPMISQISAEHVAGFFTPHADRIFDRVRSRNGLSSLFVCGDATANLAAMCASHCDNISIDENVPLAGLRAQARSAGKSFGGNLRLTVALLMGTADDCRRDTLRCLTEGGSDGFVLSPGCDLPYQVPPANLEAVTELALDPAACAAVRTSLPAGRADDFAEVQVSDYARSQDLLVDVITLDSATCPPCGYMVQAVRRAVAELGPQVRWAEHKITGREGLGYMTRLGVTHIPTICIDGRPAFSSQIPDRRTLVAALRTAAATKGITLPS